MKVIFDRSIWESFKIDHITNNDVSEELKTEKNLLNDFMCKYIFDKYKHRTTRNKYRRTNTGYTFNLRCNKYKTKKCKSLWILTINVSDKSAHLNCKFMCYHNHIASLSIQPS